MIIVKAYKLWKKKLELKLAFYTYVSAIVNNRKDMLDLAARIYLALKDTSTEELKDALIQTISALAHEQVMKERKAE